MGATVRTDRGVAERRSPPTTSLPSEHVRPFGPDASTSGPRTGIRMRGAEEPGPPTLLAGYQTPGTSR